MPPGHIEDGVSSLITFGRLPLMKAIKDAETMQMIPAIVLGIIFSLRIIRDKMGASAGFMKNTMEAVIAEVRFIASK